MNGIEWVLASRTENTLCNWYFVLRPQETTCHYPLMSTWPAVRYPKKNRWWSRKLHCPEATVLSLHQTTTKLTFCTRHHFHYLYSLFFPILIKICQKKKERAKSTVSLFCLGSRGGCCSSQWRSSQGRPYSFNGGNNCTGTSVGAGWAIPLTLYGKKWWRRQRGQDTDPCSQTEHTGCRAAISSPPNRHVWLQQPCK